ncbi:MFS transporter [Siphonobacter sp. BAB-5385]|uniref:peptide MFS transporter n=1 Tax=unclassified Siphonobacter TaxID=2635712 RepID=UPI000B9E7BF3|nr:MULTISPECIES: peptide MFS transporter [unclassified Siphonobacter]OZI05938.1 MFS transporter [Siphonobacter sp. BAB-5385]PMD96219.1 MFS transporter [Siphonobacter sp. BAB-5405]
MPEFIKPPQTKRILGHPQGLFLLFTTEMWERFSYYGMRAVLTLYFTQALMQDKAFASNFYGGYTSLVYLTPLIGGYIADKYWGNRRSILVGGLVMALGQFFLFCSGSIYDQPGGNMLLYVGLGLMIVGNGFFKPNISSMVGTLYDPADRRKDAAYTIFYMGINLGSFIGQTICALVGNTGRPEDFRWAFLACSIALLLGTVVFQWGKIKYLVTWKGEPVGETPVNSPAVKSVYWVLPVLLVVGLGMLWFDVNVYPILLWFPLIGGVGSLVFILMDKSLNAKEKQQVIVIYIVSFFVIFFWAAFEQAGASLTFFADEQVDRQLFGWTIPPALFQNFNPFFVVTCAPIMAGIWTYLGNKGIEPASPYKMAIGLTLLAIGYLIMLPAVKDPVPGVKVSAGYLAALYFFHSVGELCLSPIGLSLVNQLAPAKYSSLLMAVWFLANVAANKFAGTLSSYYPEAGKITNFLGYQMASLYDFFLLFVVMSGVAAVLLFLLSRRLTRMM